MAESKIKIANISLSKVGVRAITSFLEETPEARAINANYDEVLKEVLEEHMWTFAQKRATLATISGEPEWTDDGMDVIYAKPSDFIKLNFKSDPVAVVKVEGNRILSDTTGLAILYTFLQEDTLTYSAKFTQALAVKLAAEIAFTLTESVSKTKDLHTLYDDDALPKAVSSDSTQGNPTEAMQDEWLNSRLFGAGRFITTPGGLNAWHVC